MKNPLLMHPARTLGTILAACLVALPCTAAVLADPAYVTFTAPQQSVVVKLSNDGVPVSAAGIGNWQLMASGHDYKHMLQLAKTDGAITIGPSPTVEVGSYDLNIETTAGPVLIRVFTPLSDVPDIVEKRAALTGESEQRVKEKMGLVSSSGRATISIDLPSVYYEGQTLELSMPVKPGPQRSYAWFMNGELVAESREVSAISYTFTTPGEYVLTYLETEEADGKVAAMGQATAYTRVVAMPPVRTEVAAHTEMTFLAPPGYQQHAWRVDGLEVSTASELKHTFHTPGTHDVDCLATAPSSGPAQGFQRVRFATTVH